MADELNLVASVMELILKILPAMLDSGDAEYRWKDNRSRDSEEKEPTHLPLFICYFSFSFLIYTTKQSLSRMLASDSSSCALWETAALSHLMLLEGLFPLVPCMGKPSCCEWGPLESTLFQDLVTPGAGFKWKSGPSI